MFICGSLLYSILSECTAVELSVLLLRGICIISSFLLPGFIMMFSSINSALYLIF